jgi:glycosyltransferase involved in cell wall biosynthesis
MWKGKKVSVILPTYNEKDSIYQCIQDFFATGYVDEVVVVNNNAAEGTKEEVERTNARQVFEPEQGYGAACQRGLKEATGDLLVICEPDGTFYATDIVKLLAYSDDFQVVFGSRTLGVMILRGANMGWFIKWGNWIVAKLVEFSFNTTHLSDIGCTMKLLSRSAYEKIRPHFTVKGSHFNPELMCLVILTKVGFVEIPVKYGPRVGTSSVTGSKLVAFRLGLRMIGLILTYRLKGLLGLIKQLAWP